jgi:uncharacterized protein (DUF433 family)
MRRRCASVPQCEPCFSLRAQETQSNASRGSVSEPYRAASLMNRMIGRTFRVSLSLGDTPVLDATSAVHSDAEILGGVPVFVGTRVPVQNLFDYLSGGDSLDDFLRSFPTVSREQVGAPRWSRPGRL